MPTYDYHCSKCAHKLEAFQKITDEPLKRCPKCNEDALKRGPGGGIGLSFTGTGWYKTDYASPSKANESGDSSKGGCCPCGKAKGSCES